MKDLKVLADEVCEIAKRVGVFLREERKVFSLDSVERKSEHDYVSYVDKTAEVMLVEELAKLLPETGFITEEDTVEKSTKALNWIIDPLDGTTNYIQDLAPYCISIALRDGDDLLIGVVYEVCLDECFAAWQDGGAFLNGRQIQVSAKPLNQALIGLDLPYKAEEYKPVLLRLVDELCGKVTSLRLNGSAAMSLCYVAAGRYDGWVEAFLKPWDYSAGVLIVREAGGRITDFSGSEHIQDKHHILASNGVIHEELLKLLPAYM